MCHFTPIITTITIGELVYGAYKSDCLEFFIEKLENIMTLTWGFFHLMRVLLRSMENYGGAQKKWNTSQVCLT